MFQPHVSSTSGGGCHSWAEKEISKIIPQVIGFISFAKPFLPRKGSWSQNATFFIDD
jgi:hypothetical protein